MKEVSMRPAQAGDFPTIVQLNQAVIKATGPLNIDQLSQLHQWSAYHKVVTQHDQVVAFLLVLAADSPYQSPNYQWFNNRYTSFFYVDRIVVERNYIGQHLGSMLYADLFRLARKAYIDYIACEYNIKPLNETSQNFHQNHGFIEVSNQWLNAGTKQVSLQVCELNKNR